MAATLAFFRVLANIVCACFLLPTFTYPQQSCPRDRKLSGTKAPRRTLRSDIGQWTEGSQSAGRRRIPLSFVAGRKWRENTNNGGH